MPHVTAHDSSHAGDLATLVRENLDSLTTYATHLVGDVRMAADQTAGGVLHASKYPPAQLSVSGRAALYRAVTRACRHNQRLQRGGWLHRHRAGWTPAADGVEIAVRINTVKRALATLSFERRSALLLRSVGQLTYSEMAAALECSPDAVARLLAAARREFGCIYREIAL